LNWLLVLVPVPVLVLVVDQTATRRIAQLSTACWI
jgi:hypothetical protein